MIQKEVPERVLELQKHSKDDFYWEITHVKGVLKVEGMHEAR